MGDGGNEHWPMSVMQVDNCLSHISQIPWEERANAATCAEVVPRRSLGCGGIHASFAITLPLRSLMEQQLFSRDTHRHSRNR